MDNRILLYICKMWLTEGTLGILIGLNICRGNVAKQIKKNKITFFLKLCLSIFMLIIINSVLITRFNNLVIIETIAIISITALFLVIWNFNLRQAIIAALISKLSICISETATTPLIELLNILDVEPNIINNIVDKFFPSFFQLIIFIIIYCLKIDFSNNDLFVKNKKELTAASKITMLLNIILLFISILLNTNYLHLYFHLTYFNLKDVSMNIYLYFLQTVMFIILALLMLKRTIGYEKYKQIVNKTSKEFVEDVLNYNTTRRIHTYHDIVVEALSMNNIEKLTMYINQLNLKDIELQINKNLTEVYYDYSDLVMMIVYLLKKYTQNYTYSKCILKMKKYNSNIVVNISINTNEFDANQFIRQIDNIYYHNMKQNFYFFKQGAVDIDIVSTDKINILIVAPIYY